MEDLSFDPVKKTDTTLAEEYMEEHIQFKDVPQKGRCFVFRNGSDMVDEDLSNHNFHLQLQSGEKASFEHKIRRTFITELKENYKLFCQLEYLIRNNDVEDTEMQLDLILKYLGCYNAYWDTDSLHYTLLITEDTPLYCLGYLISGIYCGKRLRLLTTRKTAYLCYLFYNVCLHAGIDVPLFYINEQDVGSVDKISTKSKGCTAVFTEHADIQSAVDVFLNSSPRAPWRIDRILVQESMIDEVKSAFSAYGKGRRMDADRPRQYVAAFETRRGTVAVTVGCSDGASVESGGVVAVSTYRTVRELVALLATSSARFLSLWCSDLAQAHEVVAAAAPHYIWIDGYADFDGPPEVALALYNAPLFYRSVDRQSYTQLKQLSTKWCRVGPIQRKTLVLEVMDKFDLKSDLLKAYKSIENWKPKDLAQMETKKLTIVVDCPEREVIYFESDANILTALELIIRGYCVYIKSVSKSTEDLILEMNKELIPLMSRKQMDDIYSDVKVQVKAHHGNKQAIQSTFGTIFAN